MLTHRHLDRHGEGWEGMRDAVGGGWSLDAARRAASTSADPVAGRVLPVVGDDAMRARLAGASSTRPSCCTRPTTLRAP